MKYLIASDIHGSAYYCEQLLRRFEEEQADKLILLGDILYHGARNDLPAEYNSKRVTELLNSVAENILCVRGNCDSEVDATVLRFPILSEESWLEKDGVLFYLTHGHKYNVDNPPKVCAGTVVVCGHTHVPMCLEKDGVLYINPGSVSIPKNDSWNGYIVLNERKISWKNIEGVPLKDYFF